MSTATHQAGENEVTILARFLGNGDGRFPRMWPALSSIFRLASGTRPGYTIWPSATKQVDRGPIPKSGDRMY